MKKFEDRWIIKKNGNQKVLYSNFDFLNNSGIDITVNKGKKTLSIGGWYDSMVGIESREITLEEIMNLFK